MHPLLPVLIGELSVILKHCPKFFFITDVAASNRHQAPAGNVLACQGRLLDPQASADFFVAKLQRDARHLKSSPREIWPTRTGSKVVQSKEPAWQGGMGTSEAEHSQGPCGSYHPIFVGVILQFTSLYAIPIASLQNGSLLKLCHDKTLFFQIWFKFNLKNCLSVYRYRHIFDKRNALIR